MYNIVSGLSTILEIKKSKHFKLTLGLSTTKIDRSGERVLNDDDKFSFFYNQKYQNPVYMQGKIGNINFYTDHYVQGNQILVFYTKEEFKFDLDRNVIKEKGIDFFLGSLLKKIENENEERVKKSKEDEINTKREADPSRVFSSPGAVTYDDLKAYIEKRNRERVSTDNS
jgi:hypothetical protein